MAFMFLAATRDPSSTPWQRDFIWVILFANVVPTFVCIATFVVMLCIRRTLQLTPNEISAPRFGFSLHSTHVPMSSVKKVKLILNGNSRYLNIYHSAGRLGIAESLMPNAGAFNRVLVAFSDTPGADSSFKAAEAFDNLLAAFSDTPEANSSLKADG
jgi:hypothetical protein